MTDRPHILLAHHLKALKLPTFLREYEKVARQCAAEGLDHVRFLARLVELEPIDRERRMVERRIKAAKFPVAKSLDSFDFKGLCCKLGEGAMRDQGASSSPYDSALARRSCSHAMASVRAHGQRSKARSTIRASPTMPPWRANIPAWPLRSARITSKPLIVA